MHNNYEIKDIYIVSIYRVSPPLRYSNFRLVHISPFLSPHYKNTKWEQDPIEPIKQKRYGEREKEACCGKWISLFFEIFHLPILGCDLLLLLHQEASFHKTICCKEKKPKAWLMKHAIYSSANEAHPRIRKQFSKLW